MNLSPVLTDVFDRGATVAPLDRETEIDLIADAKAGDSAAIVSLIRAYAPALRGQVSRHSEALGRDEARAVAMAGFVEAIHAVPAGERLALVLVNYLRDALQGALSSSSAFTVPHRTMKRFFAILRTASGDVTEAAKIAPEYQMTEETFLAVLDAVRHVGSFEAAEDDKAGGFDKLGTRYTVGQERGVGAVPLYALRQITDADDKALVAIAFSAVDVLEAEVMRLAYGFADYDPQPDAEVGFRLGFSRAKAQRLRVGALDKMKTAVGA